MKPARNTVRRLSAILVADLVGYTEHMRADEKATLRQVKADLQSRFAPKIKVHHGRIVKTMGDGILAEFGSAVDCVECAIALQPVLATKAARFTYRMAVNVGDIVIERKDIYGDGVNLAMRLQAIAGPGEIVISNDAMRQVHGKVNASFHDMGEHAVKGVTEPVRIHRVVSTPKRGKVRVPPTKLVMPLLAAASIAVLPFDNLSGDPDRTYFSDGITNDIITDLSKFSQLFVLASHSVFTYKNQGADVREVSRALGVRYIVEGSVQNAGDRVRINVQLVQGVDGRHLWAQRYDRPLREIFALQEEIVQTVVATLVARVHSSEQQRILGSKPDSLEAYDAYLRGRAAFAHWTHESNIEAQVYFRQAITLDPGYALAYGYLSYTLVQSWLGGWEQSSDIPRLARDLARKAVDLGPSDCDNHWSLAAAYLVNRDFDKSVGAYERAAQLNPNSPNLLVDMAECLVYVGRSVDAIATIERAMQLNSIYPDWYLWTLGIAHYHAGNYEQSVAALTRGNPPNLARRHLAAAYVRLGQIDDAKRTVMEFLSNDPTYTLGRERGWPYRDPETLKALRADLIYAGLPEETAERTDSGGAG